MGKKKKVFDTLPEIPYGTVPNIILVGNGITLSFEGAKKTEDFIADEWEKRYGYKIEKPQINNTGIVHDVWKLPFPMQVVAATQDHVQDSMTSLADAFKNPKNSNDQNDLLKAIIDTNIDAILTTNYSLEFEKYAIQNPSPSRIFSNYKTTQESSNQQKQFGIFQCTGLPIANSPLLWHIHGTALRKKSMIMGQMYYGKLLSEVIRQANEVNKNYRRNEKNHTGYTPKSWVDYFLIGNVHIFGFNMDLSETDIWWLLSYKKANFQKSNCFFYNRHIDGEKLLMLSSYDVDCPTVYFDETDPQKYISYYKRICKIIMEKNKC